MSVSMYDSVDWSCCLCGLDLVCAGFYMHVYADIKTNYERFKQKKEKVRKAKAKLIARAMHALYVASVCVLVCSGIYLSVVREKKKGKL